MAKGQFDEMATHGDPALIIGVDFGMSGTGVAYCSAPWISPAVFQNWSTIASEVFNKTPSRLAYDRGTKHVRSWGLSVDIVDPSIEIKEYFKLNLDPEYGDFQELSHRDARRFYLDYMRCVHDHLAGFFEQRFAGWATMRVEWNFSVPTTWKHAGMIRDLLSMIRQAGFGTDGKQHTCEVTLTEAEAAAVSVAGQMLQREEVVLVCDAGGGTTDINIMKVRSETGQSLELEQLVPVEGREFGSALIDIGVQKHLAERLRFLEHVLPPEETAERMMLGRFERFKCSFGVVGTTPPKLFLPVTGLSAGSDFPHAGIKDSQIEVSRDLVKGLFEEQAEGIIELITEQLQALKRFRPGERVTYLIMSGGLSASQYIQERVKSHFEFGGGSLESNARGVKMLLAENMQLAVVRGLVGYRTQQIGQRSTPIVGRCAPVSYGVVVNQRYDQDRHLGQRVVRDNRDGKKWAVDQIEWLICKGDRVTDDGVRKPFRAKLRPAHYRRPWKAQFVRSNVSESLPKSMAEQDRVRDLCTVSVDLDRVEKIRRNKHWWNLGESYELAHLEVQLIPGHTDLDFRVFSGGRLVNSEDKNVRVDWSVGGHRQSYSSPNMLDQPWAE
ncbi:hypothetical protein EDD37DRAFT_651436 [Exophiala viscosa]|uniref:Uncharacterized protein n=1 Tax=Exophiala viscosa TaxID=2486360 RepID=A0AAN6DS79_9EURO|nr:hypothetical protein EDD36DRAFT_496741 [Exophiala viscosa]KAI1623260.1 hypothetical protein EDD37DRAFT_651436 [Exophiala viscosa]